VLKRAQRELFFVPWRDVTMVGTDYHRVTDPLGEAAAQPPPGSAAAFLEEVMKVAPRAGLCAEDVSLVHWGLQPTDDMSIDVPRKSALLAHGRSTVGADNLLIVVAEKLTSAPALSRQVCNWMWRHRVGTRHACGTTAQVDGAAERDVSTECIEGVMERLASRYGSRWPDVLAHAQGKTDLLQPVVRGRDFLAVEVVHAIREEMALSLRDVLRRVGLCDVSHPGLAALQHIAQVAAPEFRWNETELSQAVTQLDELLQYERSQRL
jgi:glycerol-3-phosphate dehydrogenase